MDACKCGGFCVCVCVIFMHQIIILIYLINNSITMLLMLLPLLLIILMLVLMLLLLLHQNVLFHFVFLFLDSISLSLRRQLSVHSVLFVGATLTCLWHSPEATYSFIKLKNIHLHRAYYSWRNTHTNAETTYSRFGSGVNGKQEGGTDKRERLSERET